MIPWKQITHIFLHTYLCEGRGDKKGKTLTIYRLKIVLNKILEVASIRAGREEPAQGHLLVRGLTSLQKEKGRRCQVTWGYRSRGAGGWRRRRNRTERKPGREGGIRLVELKSSYSYMCVCTVPMILPINCDHGHHVIRYNCLFSWRRLACRCQNHWGPSLCSCWR